MPHMGTQHLPPWACSPRSPSLPVGTILISDPLALLPPRSEPEGTQPGVPISRGVPHGLGDIRKGKQQARERSETLGTGELSARPGWRVLGKAAQRAGCWWDP